MTVKEQVFHDRVNLVCLVRRLDKSVNEADGVTVQDAGDPMAQIGESATGGSLVQRDTGTVSQENSTYSL